MKDCSFLILCWDDKNAKYIAKKVRGKIIDENLSCYKDKTRGIVYIIYRKCGITLRAAKYYNRITPGFISDAYAMLSRRYALGLIEKWEDIFNRAVDEYHKNTN